MICKFLLFGYNEYEKGGGVNDLLFGFSSIDEFNEKMKKNNCKYDNYHILNLLTMKIEIIYEETLVNGWYGDSSASYEILIEGAKKYFNKLELTKILENN